MKTKLLFFFIILFNLEMTCYSQVQIDITPPGTYYIGNVFFLNNRVGFLNAYVYNNYKILRTLDGGYTWDTMSSYVQKEEKPFQFVNEDTGFYIDGSLYSRTFDGGKTWNTYILPDTVYSFIYDAPSTWPLPFNINKYDSNKIYFPNLAEHYPSPSKNYGTYVSKDFNNNWQRVSNASVFSMVFVNKNIGYGLGCNGISELMKTIDGGKSWNCLNTSNEFDSVYYIQFLTSDTGFANSSKGMLRTIDGGITWNKINKGLPYLGSYSISFISSKIGYVISENATIYKTNDAGENWSLSAITSIQLQQLYAFTEDTLILYYEDNSTKIYKIILPKLSINEELGKTLKIYPNPASDYINIEWKNQNNESFEIECYNIWGKDIFNLNTRKENQVIDISEWAKGIYMIKIQSQNSIAIKKVIIN